MLTLCTDVLLVTSTDVPSVRATRKEVEMLGAFEHYHRGKTPKAKTSEFDALYEAFKVMPA